MKPPTVPASRKPSFGRAFLPFWIALAWAVVVVSWDYHVRHAALTRLAVQVTIEGVEPDEAVTVTVGGETQRLGAPVPMGYREIVVSAPDCESKVQTRFVWYGVTDLGSVNLTRSRGAVTAAILPTPEGYELSGRRGSWTNTTGAFTDVPVGRYELTAHFGPGLPREHVPLDVRRLQTSRVDRTARIGALELVSEPSEGSFELICVADRELRTNSFPATYARLPAGPYRLIAKLPGYERELRLLIGGNETNHLVVKFVYGVAEISTTPSGATILVSGNERGKSPLLLNQMVPGTYQIEAQLPGFDVAKAELQVDGEATTQLAVPLVNTKYRELMERARRSQEENQFGAALRYLEAALAEQPGDTAATKLLPEIRIRGLRSQAQELADRNEFDEALKVLGVALTEAPGDAVITALQEKIRTGKVDSERQQTLVTYRRTLAAANAAAEQKEFDKALALLVDAKKIMPDQSETASLEADFRKEQTNWSAELAERKRKDRDADLGRQFNAAWAKASAGDRDAAAFPFQSWKVAKPILDVRAALLEVAKADSGFRITESSMETADVMTAKLGSMIPLVGIGSYLRIGLISFGDEGTQIVVRVLAYGVKDNGVGPDINAERDKKRAEKLRAALSARLGAEVK